MHIMNIFKSKLIVTSVNKKLLAFYKFFIFKMLKSNNIPFKQFCLPNKTKKVTLLKSPHVNKKAKESFEIRTHKLCFIFPLTPIFLKEIKWLFLNKPRSLNLFFKF